MTILADILTSLGLLAQREPQLILRDITAASWLNLTNLPDGTGLPQFPSAQCLSQQVQCKAGSNRIGSLPSFVTKQVNWQLLDLDSWVFINDPPLVGSGSSSLLNLKIDKVTSNYSVMIQTIQFGSSSGSWPQALAIATPKGLDPEAPVNFLVYFQNTPQPGTSNFYKWFLAPQGWDWLFLQFYRWLNPLNIPVCQDWSGFQLPYQLMEAAKQFVLVIPQIPTNASPASFQFFSPGVIGGVLDTLATPAQVGSVVLAGFSNGNHILAGMITSTLASGDPISRNFLNTKVSEIYVFDPPEASGDADLHSVASWKNASSSVGTKVVRAYVHKLYPTGFQDLFGAAAAAIQSDTPAFLETPSGEASLVYLPIGADPTSNIWTRSCNAVTALLSGIPGVPQCQCASWSFEKVHHTIPALFLTDAARRSKL